MTERSKLWDGTSTGDATEAPYDAATEFAEMLMSIAGAAGVATYLSGVFRNELNQLAVTGAATPVNVATGRALTWGNWYENNAVVPIAIPTPAGATRIDRIVLRKSWAAQTVRLTRIAGVEGGAAPALTTSAGTTWDQPIAQVSITTAGVITITDERSFIGGSNFSNLSTFATGDILYAANATTLARLPAGATNTVLAAVAGLPAWTASPTVTSITLATGNLVFSGTAQRITGDMSNATLANRLFFQNSVVNAASNLGIMPSGTGTIAALHLLNSSDTLNRGRLYIQLSGATASFAADSAGSGPAPATLAFTGFASGYSFDAAVNITGLTTFIKTGQVWTTSDALTSASYAQFNNTSGPMYIGRDSSTGGTFYGVPYAGVIAPTGAYPLLLATNGVVRVTIGATGAVTMSSTLAVTGSVSASNFSANSGTASSLYRTDAAGTLGYINWGRAGVLKFILGSDASDNWVIYNASVTQLLTLTSAGLLSLNSGFSTMSIGGPAFSNQILRTVSSVTAASGGAYGWYCAANLYAAANGDELITALISMSGGESGRTGLLGHGIKVIQPAGLSAATTYSHIYLEPGWVGIQVGGRAVRSGTKPTNNIDLFNGTAPTGTLTSGATMYCSGGEMFLMDAGGVTTQQTPHDDEGNWIFNSTHTPSGKRLLIDVEKLLRALNDRFGYDFVHDLVEGAA